MENILKFTQDISGELASDPLGSLPQVKECGKPISSDAGGPVLRSLAGLHKHPAYVELNLAASPAQFATLKKIGPLAFQDPLLVTREGVIIDGYARKEYAGSLGILALLCTEIEADLEEALQLILKKHQRSPGWNDYNRIRMASQLKHGFRKLARSNQRVGGQFKGLSKLTEANVRKEVARAAGVCEANVTKVDQLINSDPEVRAALATGEIRIHRAWLWRLMTAEQQREELRLHRLERSLKQPNKARAFKHRANGAPVVRRASLSMAGLEKMLKQIVAMPTSDDQSSQSISIFLIEFPGKAALITTELYEHLLLVPGSVN